MIISKYKILITPKLDGILAIFSFSNKRAFYESNKIFLNSKNAMSDREPLSVFLAETA